MPLVLGRRVGERVVIQGDIVIEVIDTAPNRIRLGITAPEGVGIWREEVCPQGELPTFAPAAPRSPSTAADRAEAKERAELVRLQRKYGA